MFIDDAIREACRPAQTGPASSQSHRLTPFARIAGTASVTQSYARPALSGYTAAQQSTWPAQARGGQRMKRIYNCGRLPLSSARY
jgi:hypothetical protein